MKQVFVFHRVVSMGIVLGLMATTLLGGLATERASGSGLASGVQLPGTIIEMVDWYRQSANHRKVSRQVEALPYRISEGVPHDLVAAVAWVEKAAGQGNAEAQFLVGQRLLLGEGIQRDARRAAQWFYQSARNGNGRAQLALGELFLSGLGLRQSEVEARAWFEDAARQGVAEAQFRLAKILLKKGDEHEGIGRDWLKKAADSDLPEAQWMLALILFKEGESQEKVEAAVWAKLASEGGEPRARELHEKVVATLSKDQNEMVRDRLVALGRTL